MSQKILVTGIAGFIGFHISKKLIRNGYKVIGIDNLSDYYDVELKKNRIRQLEILSKKHSNDLVLYKSNLEDSNKIKNIFKIENPSIVINLAAQAGVRYSIINPEKYIASNIHGFLNILENCRSQKVDHLIYASSSSVYGGNFKIPFSEEDPVDHPVSVYASTKRSNELMAHNYSHLFQIPTTGLRFFTVYGPWGRPDMAPMIFANSIFKKKPLKVFNFGNMERDFTYIDDVTEFVFRLLNKIPTANEKNDFFINNPNLSWAPFRILNVGNGNPTNLLNFINILESEIGIKAIKVFEEMQKGDVKKTFANIDLIKSLTGYKPKFSLKKGIKNFVDWFKIYSDINH